MRKMKTIYKDPQNAMLGGVCAGLAHYFGLDRTLVRLVFFVTAFFFFFMLVPIYLLAWFILPKKESLQHAHHHTSSSHNHAFPLKKRMEKIDQRIRNLESIITSEEWQLRRKFRDIEG